MSDVVIVSVARTPVGRLGGALSSFSSVELGVFAARAAIERSGIPAQEIDQAIFGNVLQANGGQNVARQIALKSGMSERSTAMTVNEVCGSGLKAVRLGQAAILLGDADVVVVGGTESMSQAPYYAPHMRFGNKFGNVEFVDGMYRDGLSDAFTGEPMGITAENVADCFNVTREQQDEFALESHRRAVHARANGAFDSEIVPISVQTRSGLVTITEDEGPRADTSLEKLAHLKPSFKEDGSVTAGNSSPINDGAAALVLMRKSLAEERGINYVAEIVGFKEQGISPDFMGYAPKRVIESMLAATEISMDDIDLFEVNEAFAAQTIAVVNQLEIPSNKLNIYGGAIALGHPLGASGARVLTTLVHALKREQKTNGVAALCIGGGIGIAMQIKAH